MLFSIAQERAVSPSLSIIFTSAPFSNKILIASVDISLPEKDIRGVTPETLALLIFVVLANTFTHYSNPITRVIKADPMSDKDIIYKQHYGLLARNYICGLLGCDDSNDDVIINAIDDIMQQSKKDVLGFLTDDLLVKQRDFLPEGETVESVRADIDEYIGGSLSNLRRILDFIRIKKDMNEELITLFEEILENEEEE